MDNRPKYCSTGWNLKDKLDESWDRVEKLCNTGLADSPEMLTVEQAIDELSGMWEEHCETCVECSIAQSRILAPIVERLVRQKKMLMN
jgi:hypothetical protein